MFQNRATQNIPFNEKDIANVIYSEKVSSPFVSMKEIEQKSSTGKNYSEKCPGVNYKSFGRN